MSSELIAQLFLFYIAVGNCIGTCYECHYADRFGNEVMETVAAWTKNLCANVYQSQKEDDNNNCTSDSGRTSKDLSGWSVLDIGTGNGLLLQELAKQGYCSIFLSQLA